MRVFICVLWLFTTGALFSQDENLVLREKNGFRDIKLGQMVTNLPFLFEKTNFQDDRCGCYKYLSDNKICASYEVDLIKSGYDKIGNNNIQSIDVYSFEGVIYRVDINFDIHDHFTGGSLFRDLELAFGTCKRIKMSRLWVDEHLGRKVTLQYDSQDNSIYIGCHTTIVYTDMNAFNRINPLLKLKIDEESKQNLQKNQKEAKGQF